MSRFRLVGFAALLVLAALVGGTIISAVSAATGPVAGRTDVIAAATTPDAAAAGTYCKTFRAAFAANLGVDEDALVAAGRKAAATTIDQAVTDGKLTQQAGDKLKARIATSTLDVCQRLGKRLDRATGPALGVIKDGLTAAADALGMPVADLRTAIRAGTSLKTIASSKTVEYDKVTDAVTAAVKADLDQAVAAGTIKQQRADRILARLAARLADGHLRRAP